MFTNLPEASFPNKTVCFLQWTELWSCVKFEVVVTDASSLIVLCCGLCGRIATLNIIPQSSGAVVKFEVAVQGSRSLIVPYTVSVVIKQH